MKNTQTTNIEFRRIPTKLKNHFKAACAEEGKTMTEKFLEWLESFGDMPNTGDRNGHQRSSRPVAD